MIRAAGEGHRNMSSVTCQISMSLDGFVAGPNQSVEDPIGEGGMRLHEWVFGTDTWREQHGLDGGEHTADAEVVDEVFQGVGAYIMGRRMFGGGGGPWDETWTGWWGEDPPFHAPVFVLTHLEREIGARLLVREPGGLRLTPEGEILLTHADAVAERFQLAAEQLAEAAQGRRARLRIGTFPTALAALVPDLIARVRLHFPDAKVTADEGTEDLPARPIR